MYELIVILFSGACNDFLKVRLTPEVKMTPITIAEVMIKATIDLRSTPRLLLYKRAKTIARPAENPLAPK